MLLSPTSSPEEGVRKKNVIFPISFPEQGGRKSNVTVSYLLSGGGWQEEECYFLVPPPRRRVGERVMLRMSLLYIPVYALSTLSS